MKKIIKYIILSIMLIIYTNNANAAIDFSNAGTNLLIIMKNGTNTWIAISKMIMYFSWLAGIVLTISGIFKLAEIGNGTGRFSYKVPFSYIAVGAMLVAAPSTMEAFTYTFTESSFHGINMLSDIPNSSSKTSPQAILSVLYFVSMLGHIAFVRGLFILKDMGAGDSKATFGRAMTHLVGGAMAINIQETTGIFARTFFSGMNMPFGIMGW